jgi:hypothetical protein
VSTVRTGEPDANASGRSWLETYGTPTMLVFLAAVILIAVAWFLWRTNNPKAQGAALALVGVMAGHLVKEVQELVRLWFK